MREQKHETRAKKAKWALSYITCGTLMIVWSVIWLFYLTVDADISGAVYIATGIVLSGIAVVLIGLSLGNIGKEANRDENAVTDPDVVQIPPTTQSKTTVKTDPSLAATPMNSPRPDEVELETRQTRSW